ncbi:M14 family zinc carboxypeptidase [Candidatus Cyanaurora vandensis]|uniref:M14 family zinc carboxypeptidase n=1 Tax=Candidatus Cyanaurora vandensis TaxID=2714958 RepID=UPI00257E7466|nr:M14 family zinc carboxypeptidase [Candidatus Cyanaurora vandensis]
MRFWWGLLGLWLALPVLSAPDWQTQAEATNYRETSRYEQTMAYAQRLADASEYVELQDMGLSPEGRQLKVLVVSKDRAFTPAAARATGKEIILINAGIHPGEIEGKDAGLALIRDMVINGKQKALLEQAILLFIPIFGVDGHERFGPYNRINQNGPVQMGWRTTAQNYNLNRDFIKADSPEMRAWLGLFNRWLPE